MTRRKCRRMAVEAREKGCVHSIRRLTKGSGGSRASVSASWSNFSWRPRDRWTTVRVSRFPIRGAETCTVPYYTLIIHARWRKNDKTVAADARLVQRLRRGEGVYWASRLWMTGNYAKHAVAKVALMHRTISAGVSVVSTLSACYVYPRNRRCHSGALCSDW